MKLNDPHVVAVFKTHQYEIYKSEAKTRAQNKSSRGSQVHFDHMVHTFFYSPLLHQHFTEHFKFSMYVLAS